MAKQKKTDSPKVDEQVQKNRDYLKTYAVQRRIPVVDAKTGEILKGLFGPGVRIVSAEMRGSAPEPFGEILKLPAMSIVVDKT